MKRMLALAFASLSLLACNHPREGDYYEHLRTRERVKVYSVGIGEDLLRHYRTVTSELSEQGALMNVMFSDSATHGDKKCVVYDMTKWGVTLFVIVPVERFKEEYRRVD